MSRIQGKRHNRIGRPFHGAKSRTAEDAGLVKQVLISFGGGMGGAHMYYYAIGEDAVSYGDPLAILHNVLGEPCPVEIGTRFIVSIKEKKLVIETCIADQDSSAFNSPSGEKFKPGEYKRYIIIGEDDTYELVESSDPNKEKYETIMVTHDGLGIDIYTGGR